MVQYWMKMYCFIIHYKDIVLYIFKVNVFCFIDMVYWNDDWKKRLMNRRVVSSTCLTRNERRQKKKFHFCGCDYTGRLSEDFLFS